MLNRAPFAERVAGVLKGLPRGSNLVVGIHGPWGDGKTTVLSMIKTELSEDKNINIMEFNPWRFADEADMLRDFFTELATTIRAKLSTNGEEIAKDIEALTRFFSFLDERVEKGADVAGRIAQPSLEELRSRLSVQLAKSDKSIVVLVDDIDRLDQHETYTLFRLIKACADFPNVCYVLAFDDAAVAQSLGKRYGGGEAESGRAFLEKIIQVPLKLPMAMKEDLRSLCFQHVDRALNAAATELSKEEVGAFVSAFDRGVSIRLDTPRAAKRYGNSLMFALPMLKGEVNTVDLLVLEAVRAFYPPIYDCIRANNAEFAGVEMLNLRATNSEPRALALLKPIIDAMPTEEQGAVKSLLKGLFPRLGSAYGGMAYGSSWLDAWTKAKRICSPDYCPRYFTYAVHKSDVRDSEIDALYAAAAASNHTEVHRILEAFFTGGKARRVIERMHQRAKDTDSSAVPSLCLAVASLAKHIPNAPHRFSFTQPASQAAILISNLINKLPVGALRVNLAKHVIAAADPLWFGDECLTWLHVTDESDRADSNTLTKEEINEVRIALVQRIKAKAASGEPLFSVDVTEEKSLLFEWSRVEGRKRVQNHLHAIFHNDPKSISSFLQAIAPLTWSDRDVLPQVGHLDGVQLKSIKLLYDLDELAGLIRQHCPGDFENPQWTPDDTKSVDQRLAEQFMFVYNTWKREGEPPDLDVPSTASSGAEDGDGQSGDVTDNVDAGGCRPPAPPAG